MKLDRTPWGIPFNPRLVALMIVIGMCWIAGLMTQADAAPNLTTYQSKSYAIHTNLSREEAVDFGRHMDLIYREYSKRFSVLRGNDRGKQNLYLLRTRQDYVDAMAEFGINASASGGMFFYNPRGRGLATWVQGLPVSSVYSTLQHEGFHQFAFTKLGERTPLWINEGLAEYFGEAIIVDGKVRLGIVSPWRLERIRNAVKEDRALGFGQLLNITSQQWHNNMLNGSAWGHLQYDQSWSIVHFLVHGDGGRYQKRFEQYLISLSRGKTHDQSFQDAFGSNAVEPFARRWLLFLRDLEPDNYSTALHRMQFLGTALRSLHQSKSPAPESIEALKEEMQRRKFSITIASEGGHTVLDASDDALFGYSPGRGEDQPFLIVPAEAEDVPAGIAAPGLRPTPILTWVRNDADELSPRIIYR